MIVFVFYELLLLFLLFIGIVTTEGVRWAFLADRHGHVDSWKMLLDLRQVVWLVPQNTIINPIIVILLIRDNWHSVGILTMTILRAVRQLVR